MSDLGGLGSALGGLAQAALGAATAPVAAVEHVVQPGETLSGVAADHGVSVGDMLAANPQVLHPDAVAAGDRLTLPPQGAGAPAGAAPPESAPSPQPQAVADPGADAPPAGSAGAGEATAPLEAQAEAPAAQPAAQARAPGAQEPLASALARGLAGVDWRLMQQSQPTAAATAGGSALPAPVAGEEALLQALASDPRAAAGLVRLLGETAPSTLLVLAARILASDAPLLPAAPGPAARPELPPQPPGVDMAAKAAVDGDRRARIAGEPQGRDAAETPQAAWIRRSAPAAASVKAAWGLPAAFTIAHGALMSSWGRLAPGNDFFGLLPGRGAAPVRLAGAPVAGFDSLDAAALAFGARLRGDARYAAAFRTRDGVAFAEALAREGLSALPLYGPAIRAVVEAHDLARFDTVGAG